MSLTAEEIEVGQKNTDLITYTDHRLLASALGKLLPTDNKENIYVYSVRLAIAKDRSRVPHNEKAKY